MGGGSYSDVKSLTTTHIIVTIMILTCSICIEYTVFINNIVPTMHNSTSGLCVCITGSITLYNDKKYLIAIVTCVTWEDFLTHTAVGPIVLETRYQVGMKNE